MYSSIEYVHESQCHSACSTVVVVSSLQVGTFFPSSRTKWALNGENSHKGHGFRQVSMLWPPSLQSDDKSFRWSCISIPKMFKTILLFHYLL